MAIELKSYNEILGKLIRKMIADSPVNDLNTGSVLLTLLEAVATSDFDNNAAILSVLETLNIDALKNADLDARAADYGLSRITATRATGFVTIGDSSISKRSTSLYAIKPAPIAGNTIIYVNDASGWANTGSLYIGRGTLQFEGPIPYTNITNNGSFFTITLGSALQKDHLLSDSVIDSQGKTDRLISAGTSILVPSNNRQQEIRYSLVRNAVLEAGESSVANIPIVAEVVGSQGNAGVGTIVRYSSLPFPTATVINTSALIDGLDTESDEALKERIKAYASTLARGTREAILSAIIGVSDSTDGKQIASAVVTEPAKIGEPALLYIDDGTGFQPSFAGQPVDVLLSSATGGEEFLQLSNYPLPRPQIVNQVDGPVALTSGMSFRVIVDGIEEGITFVSSQFKNISAASFPEIVSAINDNAQTFRCRLSAQSTRLLIYPVDSFVETIQVAPIGETEDENLYSNGILKFPTTERSYINLYRNGELLSEKESEATLLSTPFSTWDVTSPGSLSISVDGTPEQTHTFSNTDFIVPIASASLEDWVGAFNAKYAGITASATSSNRLQIVSNKIGSNSKLSIVGGTLFSKLFAGVDTESIGKDSQFALNRQTGNIQLKISLNQGDTITAGTEDARGYGTSTKTNVGSYNLSTDGATGKPAELVIIADGKNTRRRPISLPIGSTLSFVMSGETMRVVATSTGVFQDAQVGDFVYILNKNRLPLVIGRVNNTGLFRIENKGGHTVPGGDTWIEVTNPNGINDSFIVEGSDDISVFVADAYPQIWKGSDLPTPAVATLQNIVNSLRVNLANVDANIYKTSSVKITSTTEDGGSIALPVSVGNMEPVFGATDNEIGNPSHIANKKTSKDILGWFDVSTPTSTYMGRTSYSDKNGNISTYSIPVNGVYGEELDSSIFTGTSMDRIISIQSGANNGQLKPIRELLGTTLKTETTLPESIFDYKSNDSVGLVMPISIASDDSIVSIFDGDSINKLININLWRTGRVNSSYIPSNVSFSADDADNEAGVTFGTPQVWSKTLQNTEFRDYAILFRSRNWYQSSSGATLLIRAKEWGPNGDKHRFSIEYPSLPNLSPVVSHVNTPSSTTTQLVMGSGAERATGIIGGTTIKVSSPSSNVYRYSFQPTYVDLSAVTIGDVMAIASSSGVSAANSGKFSVMGVNTVGRWVDVYNPSGVATPIGLPEETDIITIADVPGTQATIQVTCTAEGGTTSTIGSGEYFTLQDDVGVVVFWYDIDNVGTPQPSVPGASRYVEIPTVATGDSATTVAQKTYLVVNTDMKFSATWSAGNNFFTVTNLFNGPVSIGTSPNTGFILTMISNGTVGASLGGRYFRINDAAGSVAVWFNVNSDPEPAHGLNRGLQVVIPSGSTANTVATLIAGAMNIDGAWNASVSTSTISVTDSSNGVRTIAAAITSGFTVTRTQAGTNDGVEIITSTGGLRFFPLVQNTSQEMSNTINSSTTLTSVPVGDSGLLITLATKDEASSVGYNHVAYQPYIQMFDGQGFVKVFENSNPNFILKTPLLLQGVAPGIYSMESCPNPNDINLGEYFKLVPRTIDNVTHHMRHRALSQLPIVGSVDIAGRFKKIQVKSKLLGTRGGVEIVGGHGNEARFSLSGDALLTVEGPSSYIDAKISAYPSSINTGDAVKLYNTKPTKRGSKFTTQSTVEVDARPANLARYYVDFRQVPMAPIGPTTTYTISDVSATYGAVAGTVWKWEHSGNLDISNVQIGDILTAWDSTLSAGNRVSGVDNEADGFPVVGLETNAVHVLNPFGVAEVVLVNVSEVMYAPSLRRKLRVKHDGTTRYRIESLGYHNLYRLSAVGGAIPYFKSCGVAVDDMLSISGETFLSQNRGTFRVLAVTESALVFQNELAVEELHTYTDIGEALWTTNSNIVVSLTSSFSVSPGVWVKKSNDGIERLLQVVSATASQLTLANNYTGTSGLADSVSIDQTIDISGGVILKDVEDISLFDGDSVVSGDKLVVENTVLSGWFSTANSGIYDVRFVATDVVDGSYRPYVEIYNASAIDQPIVGLGTNIDGFYFLEGDGSLYSTVRFVRHSAINQFNKAYRDLYLQPADKFEKMSQSFGTQIESLGKIGFEVGAVTGVDGYTYYTGLMRTAQRIVDGYEPDASSYPGQRAVGSSIEILPPLTKTISITLNITTRDGVSLTDITNDIKSTIIRYISSLGVGEDVILSEIVARTMSINGVDAVTFTNPSPSVERITVADDQKAIITPDLISLA